MTITTATSILTKEAFSALATALNEPVWLAEKRRIAWSLFEETPMPTTADEPWRRTDLKKIKWDKFLPDIESTVASATTLSALPQPIRDLLDERRQASGRLVLVNGQLKYFELAEEVAAQGVIFTDLQTAVRRYPELVSPHLMTDCVPPSDGKFAALNAALWQNGVFLYIPPEAKVIKPFETAFLLDGEGATGIHRTLIVAEDYSLVDYIEQTASLNQAQTGLNVGVTEIVARTGAQVRYAEVQLLGQKVYNFNTKRALGGPESVISWDLGELGSALTKTFIDSQLIGNAAKTQCNGIYFLDGKQHVDIDTMMRHTGYATTGDLLIHGALKDKARSVFLGMIQIDPSGQLTDSYLKNQNLLLSETARVDSIPALQIDANDVKASHAATISQVEEEYIFYLQSRGIPRKIAVHMIVEGFFSTVLSRMGNERVKTRLMDAVVEKMGAQA